MQRRSENGQPAGSPSMASSELTQVAAAQLGQLTQPVLQEVCDLLDAVGWVFVCATDARAPELELVAASAPRFGLADGEVRSLGWHAVEHLELSSETVVHHDLMDWPPSGCTARRIAEAHHLRAWSLTPLRRDDEIVGLLLAARPGVWRPRALRVLSIVARQIATNLESARLYQEAHQILREERARNQTLEDLNQLKSTFVSTVSHELRTPMAIVKGSLDALTTNWSSLSDERRRSYLAIGRQGATRLKRLLDDLLLVARIEDGLVSLRTEPVSAASVAADVVEELRYQYPGRAVELDFPTGFPRVIADRSALWEILLNLIDNALKYSAVDTSVHVGGLTRDDQIVLTVTDRGIGIPEDEFSRLFARFERIDRTVRSRLGTGLGLYICKQLVEAMGGRIGVESQPGEGSTFSVSLPMASIED